MSNIDNQLSRVYTYIPDIMSGLLVPLVCLVFLTNCISNQSISTHRIPDRFVLLNNTDIDIQYDIRYYTSNNFIGRPINGYQIPDCILTKEAARALGQAQNEAKSLGYSLKVYDCYRPQRAVDDFVQWARDEKDTKMQRRFYPTIPKDKLFPLGYIADRSGHSRGSTLDLTLVPVTSHQPESVNFLDDYDCRQEVSGRFPDNSIDMGTGYDCFDELANTDNPKISRNAMNNRNLLKTLMENSSFVNYEKEWWHYTLRDEPFPETYFDFEIK